MGRFNMLILIRFISFALIKQGTIQIKHESTLGVLKEEGYLFGLFGIIIILFLIIDLGLLNKQAKKISTKNALYQTIFWIAISVAFGFVIRWYLPELGIDGTEVGGANAKMLEYFTAYTMEKALSVDNIFVIILILKYFQIREEYYHKILFWGILGALVFRAIFIFAGSELVERLHFVLYVFGAILIYSGAKLFFEDGEDDFNPETSYVVKLCRKHLNMTQSDYGGRFFTKVNGALMFTPLFMVLVLIETTDLIFAVDSIPAAFGVTKDKFILYTSNIFAVLGLRAMFFLLAGVLNKLHLLQKGLSFVLIFIGVKMLAEMEFIMELGGEHYVKFVEIIRLPQVSFGIVFGIITLSVILSLVIPQKEEEKELKDN